MSVYSQRQLNELNIVNASDLATYTPSLTANKLFGDDSTSFGIRGFTQELRTTPSVGVYFGDVIAPRGGGSITAGNGSGPGSFFDLENVQVLKGPQGTLFGRNTTGGSVLLVPRKPTDQWEGYLEGSGGDFSMAQFQGVLNAPLTDTVRARLGYDHQTRDGYLHNTTGVGPSDLSNVNYNSVRASVVANPWASLENYSIFTYLNSNNNGPVNQLFACNSKGSVTLPIFLPYCEQQLASHKGGSFYDVQSDFPDPESAIEQWQFINTTNWEATRSLTVKNITAFANLDTTLRTAQFGTDFQVPTSMGQQPLFFTTAGTVPGIPTTDQNSLVEEVRFQGWAFDDRLEWQGGVYYEYNPSAGVSGSQSANYLSCDLSTLGSNPANFRCNNILGVFLGAVSRSLGTVHYQDEAVYGQGTYHLLPNVLSLTGGIRYTWDQSTGTSTQIAYTFPQLPDGGYAPPTDAKCVNSAMFPSCTIGLSEDSNAPTGLVALEWTPIFDALIYAKYSRGYRQGSVNIFGVEGLNTFGPEHVDTYEIGAKRTFGWPFPGTFSVAGFYNNFQDQQIQVGVISSSFVPTTAIVNAGRSRIGGLETEASIRPVDGVRLSAAYTYLNTKLESLDLPELPPTVLVAIPTAAAGDPLPYSPMNEVSLTASYLIPFVPLSAGNVTAAATYVYTSSQQAVTPSASAFHTIPAYDLLNLYLSWDRIMGTRIDASIFATNVLNEHYWTFINGTFNATGFEARALGQPQMFGARIRYNFDFNLSL